MRQQVVFVHGMFQNPHSWLAWTDYFTARGYSCSAPALAFHDGGLNGTAESPAALDKVLAQVENAIAQYDAPIVIGHAAGGLIAQIMLNRGQLAAAVAICPMAPDGALETYLNVDAPHQPLLLIGAEQDAIVPAEQVERNFKSYTHEQSVIAYRQVAGRGHYICGEPGWEEVADLVAAWLDTALTELNYAHLLEPHRSGGTWKGA